MDISMERKDFSQRLQIALKEAHQSPDSPTALARNFNSRFNGRSITVHAARKWLVAEAIPTQDKLKILAQWLEVPAEWLRFGASAASGNMSNVVNLTPPNVHAHAEQEVQLRDAKLLEALKKLDDRDRYVVGELVRSLATTAEQKKMGLEVAEPIANRDEESERTSAK